MIKHKPASAAVIASQFLQPGDTVLEIGAADGEYTAVYAERVGVAGRVIAVEPHPDHVTQLQALAETCPQITVVPMAVGSAEGEALLYHDTIAPKRSSLYPTNVSRPGAVSRVPVTTIDALVASLGLTPALIQVDAQGAEASIVAGAVGTLALPIVWVIEVWPAGLRHAGATVADAIGHFEARTFCPHTVRGASLSWREAYDESAARDGFKHADFVMVPDALVGAAW